MGVEFISLGENNPQGGKKFGEILESIGLDQEIRDRILKPYLLENDNNNIGANVVGTNSVLRNGTSDIGVIVPEKVVLKEGLINIIKKSLKDGVLTILEAKKILERISLETKEVLFESQGEQEEIIKELQAYIGTNPDGDIGSLTKLKIKEFINKEEKEKRDKILDAKKYYEKLALSKDEIKIIQKELNSHGLNIKVDGIFGEETFNAISNFQDSAELDLVDGKIGKDTLNFLDRMLKNSSIIDEKLQLVINSIKRKVKIKKAKDNQELGLKKNEKKEVFSDKTIIINNNIIDGLDFEILNDVKYKVINNGKILYLTGDEFYLLKNKLGIELYTIKEIGFKYFDFMYFFRSPISIIKTTKDGIFQIKMEGIKKEIFIRKKGNNNIQIYSKNEILNTLNINSDDLILVIDNLFDKLKDEEKKERNHYLKNIDLQKLSDGFKNNL